MNPPPKDSYAVDNEYTYTHTNIAVVVVAV